MTLCEIEKAEKQLNEENKVTVEVTLRDSSTKKIDLPANSVSIQTVEEIKNVEEIIPSVVEPSFGIGRIMYAVLEHSFREREGDEQRNYLELPPLVAPIKCSILPISSRPEFEPFVRLVREQLAEYDLSHKVDDSSGSIGKRYARTDEVGIPFGVTIDFDTAKTTPHTVTLRYAPTMQQVRMKVV